MGPTGFEPAAPGWLYEKILQFMQHFRLRGSSNRLMLSYPMLLAEMGL